MAKNNNTKKADVVPFDANAKPANGQYKVGDWAYYAYELHQVKKVDAGTGGVTEISDGNVVITAREGNSLESDMLPLTPEIKTVSEYIKKVAEEFSGYHNTVKLNISQIYPWLVSLWKKLASDPSKEMQELVSKELVRMRQQILEVINQLHTKVLFEVSPAVEATGNNPPVPAVTFPLFSK